MRLGVNDAIRLVSAGWYPDEGGGDAIKTAGVVEGMLLQ